MIRLILAVFMFLLLTSYVFAQEVKTIEVDGKTIKVGETFDSVLTKLPNRYLISQSNPSPDSMNPNSFVLTKKYNVNGIKFDLVVGRREDSGPFRVSNIIIATSTVYAATTAQKAKTISEFESSGFFKKLALVSKDAWKLKTGGRNNSYSFKDSENPYSSFGVELTTIGANIVEVGIHWNGKSTSAPAKITANKREQLTDLAKFWGVENQTKQILEYANSQQSKRYPGGSSTAPRKRLGQINIHCGTTGETLWLGWK